MPATGRFCRRGGRCGGHHIDGRGRHCRFGYSTRPRERQSPVVQSTRGPREGRRPTALSSCPFECPVALLSGTEAFAFCVLSAPFLFFFPLCFFQTADKSRRRAVRCIREPREGQHSSQHTASALSEQPRCPSFVPHAAEEGPRRRGACRCSCGSIPQAHASQDGEQSWCWVDLCQQQWKRQCCGIVCRCPDVPQPVRRRSARVEFAPVHPARHFPLSQPVRFRRSGEE